MGVIFFLVIIAGMMLNTIFLVREIRRNEQHDSFINAVTHELKTPITSIRLYLETLQKRNVDEEKRQQFYGIMLDDTDRLLRTVEQVLEGEVGGAEEGCAEVPAGRSGAGSSRMYEPGNHAASPCGRSTALGERSDRRTNITRCWENWKSCARRFSIFSTTP